MRNILLALSILFLVACQSSDNTPENAFVMAKTEEMTKMGEGLVSKKQWKHSEPQKATRIIVVVRTADINPLSATYNTLEELEKAADSKQDKTSDSFIIFTFAKDDKHKLTLVDKVVFADPLLSH